MPFGACHSAWNFPELTSFVTGNQQNYAYNGLSLTFRYDYLVRYTLNTQIRSSLKRHSLRDYLSWIPLTDWPGVTMMAMKTS